MANVIAKYNVSAVVSTFMDNQGQQKRQFESIGILTQWDNGGETIELYMFPGSKFNVWLQRDSQPNDKVTGKFDITMVQRTYQDKEGKTKTFQQRVGTITKFAGGGASMRLFLMPSLEIGIYPIQPKEQAQPAQPAQPAYQYPQGPQPAQPYNEPDNGVPF